MGHALLTTLCMPLLEARTVVDQWAARSGCTAEERKQVLSGFDRYRKRRRPTQHRPDVALAMRINSWPHYCDLPAKLVGRPYDVSHLAPPHEPPVPAVVAEEPKQCRRRNVASVVSLDAFRARRQNAEVPTAG